MDDQDFLTGLQSNPTVYNNPKDSDIILKCGNHQVYAHRVVLRMWSPFFDRSLNSQFSVAKSAVFVIDSEDDEDHEMFFSVLKHIYGMPFTQRMDDMCDVLSYQEELDIASKVYTMADKYDFPSVRRSVISFIGDHLASVHLAKEAYRKFRKGRPDLPDYIARICGPDAPQLADPALRDLILDWIVCNFGLVGADPGFKAKLEDGSLLDTELTAKLLIRLSVRIGY